MVEDWFDENGNIKDDLNIHDRDIPCFIRLGFVWFGGSCAGCMYCGNCHTDATENGQAKTMEYYPKVYSGEIQTRKQYVEYVRSGGR